MFGRKEFDLESMGATELGVFHGRMVRRILVLNVLWILAVVMAMFWSFPGGMILVVITGLKYWYDYTDTDSLTIYDAIASIMARR